MPDSSIIASISPLPFDRNSERPLFAFSFYRIKNLHTIAEVGALWRSPRRTASDRNDPGARTVENAGGFYNVEDGSPLTSGGIGRV